MILYMIYGIIGGMLYFLPLVFYSGWKLWNSGPGGQNELGFLFFFSMTPCGITIIAGALAGVLAYKIKLVEPLTKSDLVEFIIPASFGFVSAIFSWVIFMR